MLSEKEKDFMRQWDAERYIRATFQNKLISGLPMALLFFVPIIVSVIIVYIFFPGWYTKVSNISTGTFFMIIIAVIIASVFFAFFRMHYKWEMNEQLYKELKHKEKKEVTS